MAKARYYIYRNLHKDCFSVRYKGKVIAHSTSLLATGVTFSVSQAGRERVLREKKKYVHAYVVCDDWEQIEPDALNVIDGEVKYNPYKNETFEFGGCQIATAPHVLMKDNKVFLAYPHHTPVHESM